VGTHSTQSAPKGANFAQGKSFAQAHFTPALLKQQTPQQRAELHKQIVDKFGTVGVNDVRREGQMRRC
jgi:hypothetical protein